LPPLAVYSRIDFEKVLAKGIENAAIPQTFADASELGWVKVCKQNSGNPGELAAACARAPGQRGFLRLQDLDFTTDGFVVAAPFLAGLNRFFQDTLSFSVLLAALLFGNALIAALTGADSEVRMRAVQRRRGLDFRAVALGAGVLVISTVVANVETTGSGLLLAEGFALLAAGIFVPLVLGLHWRHMNSAGAIAAMSIGAFVAGVYLLGVHLWPVEFVRISGALSGAGPAAVRRFADLDAAFNAATDPQARAAAWAALEQQAGAVANWGGLKPAAIVLVAVPFGLLAAVLASLSFKRRKSVAPAS
jgi:Na+(H+)/acetate symporter ActP